MSARRDAARSARPTHRAGPPSLESSAPVFAALGDATRLRLVARLSADGPLSIARLRDGSGVTRQAVTKHLERLAEAGLVRHSRVGRERVWALEPRRLALAQRDLGQVAREWDAALARLKAFVGG